MSATPREGTSLRRHAVERTRVACRPVMTRRGPRMWSAMALVALLWPSQTARAQVPGPEEPNPRSRFCDEDEQHPMCRLHTVLPYDWPRLSRDVESCYEQLLGTTPDAEGRMDLSFYVTPNGVRDLSVGDGEIGRLLLPCLRERAESWPFRVPGPDDEWLTVPYLLERAAPSPRRTRPSAASDGADDINPSPFVAQTRTAPPEANDGPCIRARDVQSRGFGRHDRRATDALRASSVADVTACYRDLLQRDGDAAGTVTVQWTVDRSGAVRDIEDVEGGFDDGFDQCVRDAVRTWHAVLAEPGEVTFRRPFLLSPGICQADEPTPAAAPVTPSPAPSPFVPLDG